MEIFVSDYKKDNNVHVKPTGILSRGLEFFRTFQCCLHDGAGRSSFGVKGKGFDFVRRQARVILLRP